VEADLSERRTALLDFALWPENEAPLAVLRAMQTQWRTGGMSGGIVGLDYNVLPWVMQQLGIRKKEVPEVFDGLRIAERTAIDYLNER
jgi:hypothetical protein